MRFLWARLAGGPVVLALALGSGGIAISAMAHAERATPAASFVPTPVARVVAHAESARNPRPNAEGMKRAMTSAPFELTCTSESSGRNARGPELS